MVIRACALGFETITLRLWYKHGPISTYQDLPQSVHEVTAYQIKMAGLPANDLKEYLIENVVKTGNRLGKGAYGEVMELIVDGSTLCAGKQLHDILVDPLNIGSEASTARFGSECSLMAQINHPNIVQFMGVCYIEPSVHPLLVMERLDTSLDNVLEKQANIPLPVVISVLLDIASGLVYLHEFTPPIVHRDLTARNVLLKLPSLQAKIADLGNAMIVDPSKLRILSKAPGTTTYMPPEALQEVPKYDTQLDIFSFGHLALYALTAEFPVMAANTYIDRETRILHARTEVERRGKHVDKMVERLTNDHSITRMVVRCLSNLPEERYVSINFALHHYYYTDGILYNYCTPWVAINTLFNESVCNNRFIIHYSINISLTVDMATTT